MSKYAVVMDGIVVNVAISDSSLNLGGDWVRIDELNPQPAIGWRYENGIFGQDLGPVVESNPNSKLIGIDSFFKRFSDQELNAVNAAAASDSEVQSWMDQIISEHKVDLVAQDTKDALDMLVNKSIIASERVAEVLLIPPMPSENP